MISEGSMKAAKRNTYSSTPIEQLPYFMVALKDPKKYWVLRDGKWQPRRRKSPSNETKEKISNSLKGRYVGENNPNYGRHLSEEAKRRISQANTGRIPNEETRRKMSYAHKGIVQSPETKQKRSGENH